MSHLARAFGALVVALSTTLSLAQDIGDMRRIAVLTPAPASWPPISTALAARGFIEGRNLFADVRTGAPDEFPTLARDLVRSNPQVIYAVSSALGAVKSATNDIPIVSFGPDPVEQGFAASDARPGGNVTGVAIFAAQLDGKRLELLVEAIPGQRIAVLVNPAAQSAVQSRKSIDAAAQGLGIQPVVADVSGPEDYRAAFEKMRAAGVRSLVITATSWFFRDRQLLGVLARETGIATMCEWGEMAANDCTMGYGPQRAEQAALPQVYVRCARPWCSGQMP